MDFDALFTDQLNKLKEEGNYRIFAEMERRCGSFPKADNYGPNGKREPPPGFVVPIAHCPSLLAMSIPLTDLFFRDKSM